MIQSFPRDFRASIVIFLVALPLNIAIALASGVSPLAGILSAIVAGTVAGALAGCPLQVSGPAIGLVALVWHIVANHGFEMLGPVVMVAGMLQIALGLSGLTLYLRAVAPSVIHGALAGAVFLVFAAHFQVMLGQTPKETGLRNLLDIPQSVWEAVSGQSNPLSSLLGALTLVVMLAWTRVPGKWGKLPNALVGVLVAMGTAALFSLNVDFVDLPTNGLPKLESLTWKSLEAFFSSSGLGLAIAVALLSTAQTLYTTSTVDRMVGGLKSDKNREALAQGVANTICGFFCLLPVAGAPVRSVSNVEVGATSRASSILQGIWIALILLFFSPVLGLVPLAALSAVLVYESFRLFDLRTVRELRQADRYEPAIYAVTLLGVVSADLLTGIVVGLVASAFKLMFKMTHYSISTRRHEETGVILVEMHGNATALSLPKLAERLEELPARHQVHLFLKGLRQIDHACLEFLMSWEERYYLNGGEVSIEWDDLIQRFRRPTATDLKLPYRTNPTPPRRYECLDLLASRAHVLPTSQNRNWEALGREIVERFPIPLPKETLVQLERKLQTQLALGAFSVVKGVALPHIMLDGVTRHELVVVKLASLLRPRNEQQSVETVVLLVSPEAFTEHLNILARLSSRAEENLSVDLRLANDELSVREALLRHSSYVTMTLESDRESEALADKALWQLSGVFPKGCLVTYIDREGESFVPTGNTRLKLGDRLLILGSREATSALYHRFVRARRGRRGAGFDSAGPLDVGNPESSTTV